MAAVALRAASPGYAGERPEYLASHLAVLPFSALTVFFLSPRPLTVALLIASGIPVGGVLVAFVQPGHSVALLAAFVGGGVGLLLMAIGLFHLPLARGPIALLLVSNASLAIAFFDEVTVVEGEPTITGYWIGLGSLGAAVALLVIRVARGRGHDRNLRGHL